MITDALLECSQGDSFTFEIDLEGDTDFSGA